MYGMHNVKFIMQPGSTAAGRPVTAMLVVMSDWLRLWATSGQWMGNVSWTAWNRSCKTNSSCTHW